MPIEYEGHTLYNSREVADAAGVSRQTIWRWHQAGKIPAGRRFRGRDRLFTTGERDVVCEYAHRMEPIEHDRDPDQLHLFTR
jgi:hypothetical protein